MWYRCPLRRQRDSRLSLRRLRRVLVMPAHELMQGEGDLVGMRCAPGNNALELDGIVEDGADFHQFGFDDLWVSHRDSSMAHVGTWKPGDGRLLWPQWDEMSPSRRLEEHARHLSAI